MRPCLLSSTDVGVGWRPLLVLAVLTVSAVILWPVDAGYERTCTIDEMNGRRTGVCGSRLVDLLRVVCRSVYNKRSADYAVRRRERLRGLLASIQSSVRTDNVERRRTVSAAITMTTPDDSDVDDDGSGDVGSPFMSRHEALSFTSTRRRDRRSILRQGVVCECCVHRCHFSELEGYCGSSPTS